MSQLVNLTEHSINILLTDGADIAFNDNTDALIVLPSGIVARVETQYDTISRLSFDNNHRESWVNVDIRERRFTKPYAFDNTTHKCERVDFPAPQHDVFYIVSRHVAEALLDVRNDLLVVDTLRRDKNGKVNGCEALARLPRPTYQHLSHSDIVLTLEDDEGVDA